MRAMHENRPDNKTARSHILGPLSIIASAVLFGFMPLMTKTAYAHGWNAFSASAGRFLIASLILLVFLAVKPGMRIALTRKEMASVIKVAAVFAFVPIFLYGSYSYVGSGLATTLHFSYPVFVVAFECLIYRVKVTKRQLACLLLCMIGMVLIYTPGGDVSFTGIVLAVISGVLFALYIVLYERSYAKTVPALTFAFWQMLISSIEITLIGAIMGRMAIHFDRVGVISIICLAVLAGFLGTIFFQIGIRLTDGIHASLLSTFEPLTGVLVGIFYYREALTLRSAAGMAAILAAAALLVVVGEKSET